MGIPCWTPVLTVLRHGTWIQTGKSGHFFNKVYIRRRGNTCSRGFVNLGVTNVCLDTSSYLTVVHSLAEEAVQQQVLQLSVAVKRLFDFTQEDTVGREARVQIRFKPWSVSN